MAKRVISRSIPEASKLPDPLLATGNSRLYLFEHNQVDWGKISAYLAMFTLVGGAMWQFADVYISVRNLRDDIKELQRESENLLRISVETSVRVTVLERGDTQQPHAISSSCPAELKGLNNRGQAELAADFRHFDNSPDRQQ
jgi:hypothetical protein